MLSYRFKLDHAVAALGLILAGAVYCLMLRFHVPDRIAFGSAILSILVVAVFWSAINLGSDEEDE